MKFNILQFVILLVTVFYMGCSNLNKKYVPLDFIVKESLHEAIAKEKLPNIEYLLKEDTIYVLPLKQNSEKFSNDLKDYSFDKEIFSMIPSHIDRWIVKPIDSTFVNNMQISNDFYYILLLVSKSDKEFRIDVICEVEYEDKEIYTSVDRGRLTIVFKYESGIPVIKKMWKWWG